MTREPTDAELKEFWEKCGLKYFATKPKYLSHWLDTKGEQVELALDLNNLFQWAVPVVLKKLEEGGEAFPLLKLFFKWQEQIISITNDDMKVEVADLALFRVCQEVLHD